MQEKLIDDLKSLGKDARRLLQASETDLYFHRRISSNFETELIQVAASAIAALIDLRMEPGDTERLHVRIIEEDIRLERVRQDLKFGSMPRNYDPLIWIAILLEELAEVAEEVE